MAKKKVSKAAKKSKPAAKSPVKKTAKAKGPKKSAAKPKATAKVKTAGKPKTAAKKTPAKKVSAPAKESTSKTSVRTKNAPSKPTALFTTKTKSAKTTSVEFSPLRDFVLIQRAPELERTAGGLYIPGTASEKPMLGQVLSVGPGAVDKKGRKRPLDVKVGDQVLFGKYAGTEIQIDGASFLILKENDILGVSSEEAN